MNQISRGMAHRPVVANILCHAIDLRGITPSQYEQSTRYEHQYARIIQTDLGLPVVHLYMTHSSTVIRHFHKWGYPMVGCPVSLATRFAVRRPDRYLSASTSLSLLRELTLVPTLRALHIHAYHILEHDLIARRFRKATVISHDHGDPGWPRPLGFMRTGTWWSLRRFSDAVVVQSTKERERVLAHGVEPGKVRLIFPGVDEDVFVRMEKQRARHQVGLSREAFVFLFTGVLYHRKGVDLLLKAFGSLVKEVGDPRVVLVILGSGAQEMEYRQLTEELGLGGHVTFAGNVDQGTVAIYLNAADVFVAPSRAEPQGKMNLEAMMCGLPVISTNSGGTPDTVLHGKTGILVPPEDVPALYRAMLRLYTDPNARYELGSSGYRHARANFGWRRAAADLADVYRQLGLRG